MARGGNVVLAAIQELQVGAVVHEPFAECNPRRVGAENQGRLGRGGFLLRLILSGIHSRCHGCLLGLAASRTSLRAVIGHTFQQISFISVISSMAYRCPSLPVPLSLTPPYGMWSARYMGTSLIITPPTSNFRAARKARWISLVKMPACRPDRKSTRLNSS